MARDLKLEIETGARDLAERIREYSRSQVELWQQVPLLALEAQEKDSPNNEYRRAYEQGYLSVNDDDFTPACVDLETGELIRLSLVWTDSKGVLQPKIDYTNPEQAPDYAVLIAYSLDLLDAERIVKELKDIREFDILLRKDDAWREQLKQQLGLTEKYQRRK